MSDHAVTETCHITLSGTPLCRRYGFVTNAMREASAKETGFPVVCQYANRAQGLQAAAALARRYQPGLVQLVEGACPHE